MKFIHVLILVLITSASFGQHILSGEIKFGIDSTNIDFQAQIIILGSQKKDTLFSNKKGEFYIELNPGAYQIEIDRVGYLKYTDRIDVQQDIEIEIFLQEGEMLEEVEVSFLSNSTSNNGKISLSRRDFNILPASFDDPTRLLMKYQSMSTANDQANSVIFRGLPSHYITWSLNEVMIVNPNHTSNAGTISDLGSSTSGGTNMIGGQMIDRAVFNSSAQQYTFNTLSGTNNLKTSRINKYFQVSFLGIEGGYQFSDFSVGYRYSFTGLLADMGVDFGGEEIRFQDLNFRFHPNLKKGNLVGSFVIGNSSNEFNRFDQPVIIKEYQDIDYRSSNLIGTLTYTMNNFSMAAGYSNRKDERFARGQVDRTTLTFMDDYDNQNQRYFAKVNYQLNLMSDIGFHIVGDKHDTYNLFRRDTAITREFIWAVSPFVSWNKVWRQANLHVSFNPTYRFNYNEFSPDFMIGIMRKLWGSQQFRIDIQHVSMTQPAFVHLYSAERDKVHSSKSINTNFNYNLNLQKYGDIEFQAFYHYLYDIPLTENGLSAFNNIDLPPSSEDKFESSDDARVSGVSMQYELDQKQWWLNINASYFVSQYKKADEWIASTQDYGHTFNATVGKIWSLGNNSRFLRVGIGFHHRGGAPIYPLKEGVEVTDYEYNNGPLDRLSDYWRLDGRISYSRSNNIWSLDIQNMSNQLNDAYYYRELPDFGRTLQMQLGLIPVLSYRKML